MKKIIAIIMAAAMVLALCACSGSGKDVSGSVAPAEDEKLDIGTVTGGVYENKFLGIGCELDSNWTYSSKEELAALINATAENISDEELSEQILKADMFYDMAVYSNDGYANMNIIMQNMGVLYGKVMDEETVRDMNLKQLPDQMASAGFENVKCEKITVDFAGAEHSGIYMTSLVQGIECYQLCVFVKQGSYIANLTCTSFVEDITADLAQCFYAVEK